VNAYGLAFPPRAPHDKTSNGKPSTTRRVR